MRLKGKFPMIYESSASSRCAAGPKIAAIGGGTGLSTMLRGLKKYTDRLTAIVTVADDGGGSGVLRREMGILPPGDVRQCMQALANTEPVMEQLLGYRFPEGQLKGQSFGNLLLAALNGMAGSFEEAVAMMGQVLAISGRVLPVTNADVQLEAVFENGARVVGESHIFNAKKQQDCRIHHVSLVPERPKALPDALHAISEADLILLGPGSLYTSVIPNLLVDGVADTIRASHAQKFYICNIMTQDGETEGYTAADHLEALQRHGREGIIDLCLANNAPIPHELAARYSEEDAELLRVDRERIAALGIALAALPLTRTDVDDAEARLERFAPFIKKVFPETAADRGLIESPLTEIEHMRAWLNENEGAQLAGKLFLKRDSDLPVAGSVKARGGCYAVLKHTEDLALANRLVEMRDDYSVFATRAFRNFFSQYELHVGSTGNLGLSIGIMGAALGYRVTVHMSADARQWKKDLLRAKGVTVLEYGADYSYAVQKGRERAAEDPRSYFIDDENSVDLFLGYAVAARRLKAQFAEQNIAVDDEHPLLVYIPCGVGGAPGGICFGLKQEFGDAAHVYFAEPVEAPCMLLGLASGLQNAICVQDIGLTGRTAADGLAVSRPSGFVGETVKEMVGGGFTVSDEHLFTDLHALHETEGLFVEPSACAGFAGAVELSKMTDYLESSGLGAHWENAAHIVWATGGALVPEGEREKYLAN